MLDLFMKVFRSLILFCAITLSSFTGLQGQIRSFGHSGVFAAGYIGEYPDDEITDSIYVYCGQKGDLEALPVGGEGEFTFHWYGYDPAESQFVPLGSPVTGASSRLQGLESGGYRVRISADGEDDVIFIAWVFENDPGVTARVVRHDCQVLDLLGSVTIARFEYFDPVTGSGYTLPEEYSFTWSADPFVPVSSARLDPRIWNPPPVETTYTLDVNYLSCNVTFGFSEDPVTTRAEFDFEPREGEAPLEVIFDAGLSRNAEEYYWYFDYRGGELDLAGPDYSGPSPEFTYYVPGEYDVTLRTVRGLCDNIFTHPDPVRVLPSELEVANVFSPNGDGDNDIFMVRAVSLREFRGEIYNRNGRKIFEWTDPSEGWDGSAGGGGTATPGTYFYVITGIGWDDREYEFTGPLYLFR